MTNETGMLTASSDKTNTAYYIKYIYSHKSNPKLVLISTLKDKTMAKYINVTVKLVAKSGFVI